jgi:L-threonylcarbamoyladenylate synthase
MRYDVEIIDKAVKILKNDGVVAIPTETVYGLAASITSDVGLNKIFSTKERPFFDPLIVHVNSKDMAKSLTIEWTDVCDKLADAFWPGPMTMVLKKDSKKVSDLITSGLDSVGLRIPNHKLALDLISKVNIPLAAPSANKFKKTSPTSASHVQDEFGGEVFVVDGGECSIGIESTVLSVKENSIEIYRPGMLTKEDIEKVLNDNSIEVKYTQSPVAPGQLEHHYMPKIPIIISWDNKLDEKQIQKKSILTNPFTWKLDNNFEIIARKLYSEFRIAQDQNYSCIILEVNSDYTKDDKFRGILNRISKAKSLEFK